MPSPEKYEGYIEGKGIHFKDLTDENPSPNEMSGPEWVKKVQQMAKDVQDAKAQKLAEEDNVIEIKHLSDEERKMAA